jgi:hypothetical protein
MKRANIVILKVATWFAYLGLAIILFEIIGK